MLLLPLLFSTCDHWPLLNCKLKKKNFLNFWSKSSLVLFNWRNSIKPRLFVDNFLRNWCAWERRKKRIETSSHTIMVKSWWNWIKLYNMKTFCYWSKNRVRNIKKLGAQHIQFNNLLVQLVDLIEWEVRSIKNGIFHEIEDQCRLNEIQWFSLQMWHDLCVSLTESLCVQFYPWLLH